MSQPPTKNEVDTPYPKIEKRASGFLKFFHDQKDYGFMICDETGNDIFFHFEDMKDTSLTRQQLIFGSHRSTNRVENQPCFEIHLSFEKHLYEGRYGQSFKAVKIQLNSVKRVEKLQKVRYTKFGENQDKGE
jgi:hypothetical protein